VSFLNPITALTAAAITLPLLLLLYFLKLRRRYMRVPSTLLWERAFEDLEVNTPFQRLRFSALLLLQLLLLAALLIAMARPVTDGEGGREGRLILLIDRSASMNALVDADTSRLDAAKAQAVQLIDRLGRGAIDTEVMVIALARTPGVVTSFTHDRRTLIDAINSITPSDEQADLEAALRLAAGFAGHSEEAGEHAGEVILFSDGAVGRPDDSIGFRLRNGRFRYVHILDALPAAAGAQRNLGITSFSARRDIDDPARVVLFARLINTAGEPVEPVLTLRVDGRAVTARQVTVPGAALTGEPDTAPANDLPRPGEETVTFSIELPEGGVITIEHNIDDALRSDNIAHLNIPPPDGLRIALVHPGDGPGAEVHALFEETQPRSLQVLAVDLFNELDTRDLDAGERFDLVIFDRVSPRRLPGVPSITFGGAPSGVEVRPPADDRGRRILSWDRQHPVMRHVSLDMLRYVGFGGYELPPGATALARGQEGPVIALVRRRGANHLLVGFELNYARTNWLMDFSIAVFIQNALDYLTLARSGQQGLSFQPGESISVRARSDARELRLHGPAGRSETIDVTLAAQPGAERSLPALRRAGVYEVDGAAPPMNVLAINTASEQESDIRPREQILVNAEASFGRGGGSIVPRELWPWLVLLALVLLIVEWLLYCRRAAS
jgi:hypothetical protein